jgi:hypothetical protein
VIAATADQEALATLGCDPFCQADAPAAPVISGAA